MNLADLVKQRTRLLLKESTGSATESDLKQLTRLSELISRAESAITSEENKSLPGQDEKIITDLEGNTIKPKPDDLKDLDLDDREDLDFSDR